jgi:hypothetical protein
MKLLQQKTWIFSCDLAQAESGRSRDFLGGRKLRKGLSHIPSCRRVKGVKMEICRTFIVKALFVLSGKRVLRDLIMRLRLYATCCSALA